MIRNVLIVDDSQVDRSRLEKLMSDSGYQVATANDGTQAIEAAKRIKPDLIFMDVNMPEMDGFAATRSLHSDGETKEIPIILVTAKGQKADKAWGQMLGAKGYIVKPYTDEQVLEAVKAL